MILTRQNVLAAAVAAMLVVAFAFGGGGSRFGIANLAVQIAALVALAAFPKEVWRFWNEAPLALRLLVAASVLVPLVHLAPLPSSLWSTLPGRDMIARSFEVAEIEGAMPLSLFPLRTALAATALITPLAILALGWSLPRHHLFNLGWMIVGMGIIVLLIGALQLSDGSGRFEFWPEGLRVNALLGTFANRNTAGLFLVGALGFALLLPVPLAPRTALLARVLVAAMLLTAIILTQSRTALVLAVLPLMLGLLHFATGLAPRSGRGGSQRAGIVAAAVMAIGLTSMTAVVLAAPGRLADTLARFEGSADDPRRFIWEDATYSAARYWPAGAGMGTFDDVFQVDEAIENIASARRAGRAHNDYLEVTIEAGAIGLAMIALWLGYLGWLTWSAHRAQDRWAAWAASSFLLAIALQSITDYPLRNQTMLAMAAFALVVLVRAGQERRA